jgi:hypothetical protein
MTKKRPLSKQGKKRRETESAAGPIVFYFSLFFFVFPTAS